MNLLNRWNFYYHLANDKEWTLQSYHAIFLGIHDVNTCLGLAKAMSEEMVQNNMLFLMREGITPMWEDPKNRKGGCFSYKIPNEHVHAVWISVMFALFGESITVDAKKMKYVNGITISPKKKFCILKIWMADCTHQDCSMIIPIADLPSEGCLFKQHEAEF